MIIPRTSHGLAHALFKNLRVMIGVFSVCVGLAIAYLLTATPVYQASASLAIDFSQNAKLEIYVNEGQEVVLPETRRATVANYERLLTSRDLLSEIIVEIGIQRLFPDFDAPAVAQAQTAANGEAALTRLQLLLSGSGPASAADTDLVADDENLGALTPRQRLLSKAVRLFRADFMIDSSNDNTVIELSFFHEDPDLATYTLSRIIDKFISRRAELFQNPHLPFLEDQLAQSQRALTVAKEELFAYRRKTGIFLADKQLERMVEQRETIQSEVDSLSYELAALGRGSSASGARSAASRGAAETRITFLMEQISTVDDRIAVHVGAEHELAQYEQEVESKEKTYDAILTRIEKARFAESVNATSISPVSVLDQPKTGDKPARPRKTLLLLGAMVLGGFASLVIGVGREIVQTRFATPDQVVAELDLPALAVISSDAPNILATLFGGKSDGRPSPRDAKRRARKREEMARKRARQESRGARSGKPTQAAARKPQPPVIDASEAPAPRTATASTQAPTPKQPDMIRPTTERNVTERTVDVSGVEAAPKEGAAPQPETAPNIAR